MRAQRVEPPPGDPGLAYLSSSKTGKERDQESPALLVTPEEAGTSQHSQAQDAAPLLPPANEPLAFGCLVVGRDAHFSGSVSVPGMLRVEGRIDGEIEAVELTVLPGGTIVGNVTCNVAVIHGTFSGTLDCAEQVVLVETAMIEGELTYHKDIQARSGARLNCTVTYRSEPLPIHRIAPTDREEQRLPTIDKDQQQRTSLMTRMFGTPRQTR